MSSTQTKRLTLILVVLCLLSPLLALRLGYADIDTSDILHALWQGVTGSGDASVSSRIVLELRLPRIILAMLCGAGLAIAGAALQSATRNPLADPYLFGLSSGASFGAVLALTTGIGAIMLPVAAFAGALIAVTAVMLLASTTHPERLILAGVAISFLLASLTNLLLYFGEPQAIQAVLFWSMGSFARAQWADLWLPALMVTIALPLLIRLQLPLQALLSGDESAHTQGVAVQQLRFGVLVLAALLTASLVAQCGAIGFVGLMVPHAVRLLTGNMTLAMMPITALCGALLMVWVDLLSRWIMPSQQLPVGVITALLGSVFFIGLLVKRQRI